MSVTSSFVKVIPTVDGFYEFVDDQQWYISGQKWILLYRMRNCPYFWEMEATSSKFSLGRTPVSNQRVFWAVGE